MGKQLFMQFLAAGPCLKKNIFMLGRAQVRAWNLETIGRNTSSNRNRTVIVSGTVLTCQVYPQGQHDKGHWISQLNSQPCLISLLFLILAQTMLPFSGWTFYDISVTKKTPPSLRSSFHQDEANVAPNGVAEKPKSCSNSGTVIHQEFPLSTSSHYYPPLLSQHEGSMLSPKISSASYWPFSARGTRNIVSTFKLSCFRASASSLPELSINIMKHVWSYASTHGKPGVFGVCGRSLICLYATC